MRVRAGAPSKRIPARLLVVCVLSWHAFGIDPLLNLAVAKASGTFLYCYEALAFFNYSEYSLDAYCFSPWSTSTAGMVLMLMYAFVADPVCFRRSCRRLVKY